MNKAFMLWISVLFFVAACGTQQQTNYSDQPAVISSTGPRATEKISEAIGSLLNKNNITIAEDAFTESNLLVIHRVQLLGRDYGAPDQGAVERFRLVKQNESCIVVHEGTEKRENLAGVSCDLLAEVE